MSTNLYWLPDAPKEGRRLPVGLKWVLQQRHGSDFRVQLTELDREFLLGARAALREDAESKKGIDALLEAIDKYGTIVVWTE